MFTSLKGVTIYSKRCKDLAYALLALDLHNAVL
jgi:hypothetical protein